MKNKTLCATIILCGVMVAGAIGLVLGSYGVLMQETPVRDCGTQLDNTGKVAEWRDCQENAQ